MHPQNVYLEALDQVVLTDLPDEAYPQALAAQVALLSGIETDDAGVSDPN